jgi:hypothetical protein
MSKNHNKSNPISSPSPLRRGQGEVSLSRSPIGEGRGEVFGVFENAGHVLSYEIQGLSGGSSLDVIYGNSDYYDAYSKLLVENRTLAIGEFRVAPYGKENNLLPYEIRDMIQGNKLLPRLIEKQVQFIYGNGPYLFVEEIKEDKVRRIPVKDENINAWLNSWHSNGLSQDYKIFLQNQIREYYYCEQLYTRYKFNKSRRINGAMPVRGLESVMNLYARMASNSIEITFAKNLVSEDFQHILVGNWLNPIRNEFSIYNRFDPSNPFKYPVCINQVRNGSFGEDVYSYVTWYYGLRDWIKLANLDPKYVNSYFKNSLNAKIHVLIPGTWVSKKKELLTQLCDKNKELIAGSKPPMEEYNGIKLYTTINTVKKYEFREEMVTEFIRAELRKITELMSGEGENQGKLFSSIKYNMGNGVEEWDFKEIPTKYAEFIKAILDMDRRTDEAITAGLGLDPSISNISKEGIISKSGSDVYYNFLIYISTLSVPEEIICWDINKAIELNFPYVKEKGIRLGFYHNIPEKQQDVSPQDRLSQSANK